MLSAFTEEACDKRIIVALDCPAQEALRIADALQGRASWLKVGMTLYYADGPAIVAQLKERGFKVFLDLKLHDIPHQIEGAAAAATQSGADMLTVHASGGLEMMRAAKRGACSAAQRNNIPEPLILAVTVLTSMNKSTLESIGVARPLPEQVHSLAQLAAQAGIAGVVASPQEAAQLRALLGAQACIVTPGVRPAGSAKGDQSRIATPLEAFQAGASHIVVGRPITQADDVAAAFDAIVQSLHL